MCLAAAAAACSQAEASAEFHPVFSAQSSSRLHVRGPSHSPFQEEARQDRAHWAEEHHPQYVLSVPLEGLVRVRVAAGREPQSILSVIVGHQ